MSTDVRARAAERQRAKEWFESLPLLERWRLGDELVLDTFDWRDWFDAKPTANFLRAIDDARIAWESSGE